MSKSRTRGRRGQGGTAALEVFSRPKQSLPVVLLLVVWRWRWELIIIAALIVANIVLTDATGVSGVLILIGALLVLIVIPPTRRFIRTRVWCVVTRHRLRSCLNELRTLNYSGNLPFILHTHGTKVGESTWLWMRPGLSVTDLEGRLEHMAAATWGREVHISRSRRMAALVRVDTVRRDPLTPKRMVVSPLLDHTSGVPSSELGDLPDSVITGLTTPGAESGPVHRPVEPDTASNKKPRKTTSAATAVAAGPVVLIGGEDVSDYV